MNTIKQMTIALCIVLIACTGCKKWLDVKPKTNVSESVLFEDEQGFKDALTGVYLQLASPALYAKEFTMGTMDVFAQYYDVAASSHNYNKAGLYEYTDGRVQSTIDGFWRNSYSAIANINNLLEAIDAKRKVFTGNNYELVKGEALGLRAFLHFDLLRAFGPVPLEGLDQKSIPYVSGFNMKVRPAISGTSLIDSCLKDLQEATNLLAVNKSVVYGQADPFLSHTRNHFNYWAANGLMARIYLYKGDHVNAYEKASLIINNSKLFPFVDRATLAGSTPSRTFVSEHLFGIYMSDLKGINDQLFTAAAAAENNVLTNKVTFISELFEGSSTDFRRVFLWKNYGGTVPDLPVKYLQDDIQTNSMFIKRIPLIRLSEMFYIAAESATNPSDQIKMLNSIRKNRGVAELSADFDPAKIQTEIFKEYRKEFCQEGQLFFYYKRTNTARINGYGKALNSAVYVFPKPLDEIEFNPQ
ncbi:RagB/SusD family nutrient uptake outer membrane protein [Pedobacter gandavensis]|uniref:RagB/SusD family nutrient uptake outer membrane protein n=1 Tax=Pedobacter gandavensis TaxID=2679963 RepID=UPI00292F6F5A|nr:RagB/SusD family nutrient uptake outer membrane protein [Pedobacter gandavensis]